jgi:hypothetical protein
MAEYLFRSIYLVCVEELTAGAMCIACGKNMRAESWFEMLAAHDAR